MALDLARRRLQPRVRDRRAVPADRGAAALRDSLSRPPADRPDRAAHRRGAHAAPVADDGGVVQRRVGVGAGVTAGDGGRAGARRDAGGGLGARTDAASAAQGAGRAVVAGAGRAAQHRARGAVGDRRLLGIHPRRDAAAAAGGRGAEPALRRAAHGKPRAAGLSRVDSRGARSRDAARPGVRADVVRGTDALLRRAFGRGRCGPARGAGRSRAGPAAIT